MSVTKENVLDKLDEVAELISDIRVFMLKENVVNPNGDSVMSRTGLETDVYFAIGLWRKQIKRWAERIDTPTTI